MSDNTNAMIILLGRCCRVSFDMINHNLKGKTSLFEWVWSNTLTEVNIIIEKLINNQPLTSKRMNGHDYIEGTNIITGHYLNKNYDEILSRRAKRFINNIKGQKKILFIRDDAVSSIKLDEIERFFELIKTINPQLSFKFLLLSESNVYNKITYPNLHHEIYNKSLYRSYINNCFDVGNIRNSNTGDISD